MYPKVAVVILNYNGKNWLEQFLSTVIEFSTYPNTEIIIADNASTDNSVEYLKTNFPAIRIVENPTNTGYAGGYNDALQKIESDYYVLLNSDVEVTPNWIEHTMQFLLKDNLMVACQPKILSYNEKNKFEYAGAAGGFIDKYGYPFCRGRIFDTCEIDKEQYNKSGEIFWASGACLFINAKIFHNVGGLDADFFAHMEEIDLCWRLKNLGYKIGYCAESTVYHVGGGTLDKSNPRKTFLNFRNNRALLHKNLPENDFVRIDKKRHWLDIVAYYKAIFTGNTAEANAIKEALIEYDKHKTIWKEKQTYNEQQIKEKSVGSANKIGLLEGSIVLNYFIKRKKEFSELKF